MRVFELAAGDIVEMAGTRATFIGSLEHPIWPHLTMVIWKIHDNPDMEWSHDALNFTQQVGDVVSLPSERQQNLRRALLHPSQL